MKQPFLLTLYIGSLAVILAALISLGYVFYLLTYPLDIVRLKSFTTAATVEQAGQLPYTLSFEKKLNYKPQLRYYVTSPDRAVVEITVDSINRPIGNQVRDISLSLPETIEPGCGLRLELDVSYPIILNHSREYHWEASDTFCVTPAEASAQ